MLSKVGAATRLKTGKGQKSRVRYQKP